MFSCYFEFQDEGAKSEVDLSIELKFESSNQVCK